MPEEPDLDDDELTPEELARRKADFEVQKQWRAYKESNPRSAARAEREYYRQHDEWEQRSSNGVPVLGPPDDPWRAAEWPEDTFLDRWRNVILVGVLIILGAGLATVSVLCFAS